MVASELLLDPWEQTMHCWLLIAIAATTVADDPVQRFAAIEPHMGTKFEIVVYATTEQQAQQAFNSGFKKIAELDAVMSDYDAKSELSCLSQSSPNISPVPVSKDLFTVLDEAIRLSQRFDGAFDVTVGPLTKLWRRARRRGEYPDPEMLKAARAATGHENLVLDRANQAAQLKLPDMRLDLGGIAKGYAADEALRAVSRHGIRQALINAGGDLVAGDPPPGERGWRVAVASRAINSPPIQFLQIENQAVATSGDIWQFVEIGGVRYSHILDPRTGLGLTNRTSVTVVAPTGIAADSLASTVSVLGPQNGLKFIESEPLVEALILAEPEPLASEPEELTPKVTAYQTTGFGKLVEVD